MDNTNDLIAEFISVKRKLFEILTRQNETDIGLALDFDELKYYGERQAELVTELLKRGFDIKELNPIRVGLG